MFKKILLGIGLFGLSIASAKSYGITLSEQYSVGGPDEVDGRRLPVGHQRRQRAVGKTPAEGFKPAAPLKTRPKSLTRRQFSQTA